MPSKALSDADFSPPKLTDADFGGPATTSSPEVIQEMPDEVSVLDRLKAKNFISDPNDQVSFLKQKHPDLEIKAQDGNILMRKPGEPSYKVLDPNQPWSQRLSHPLSALGEGAMDLGDVAYDLGSGAASTAAGAGAALAALPETFGIGSMPAAMAASGATGTGAELLKQNIGNYLSNSDKGIDWGNVGISGAASAAAPLLFGTGASAANIAAKASEDALTPAETEILKNAQRGLVGKGFSTAMSKLSGVSKDTIDSASKNLDKIKVFENSKTPNQDLAQMVLDDVSTVKDAKNAAGAEGERLIAASKGSVNLEKAKQPYLDAMAKFDALQQKALEANDAGAFDDAAASKKEVEDEFNRIFGNYGESTSPQAADDLLKPKIKDAANVSRAGNKGIGVADQLKSPSQLSQNLARQSGQANSNALKDAVPGLAEQKAKYKWMNDLLKHLGSSTKSEDKALALVNSINEGGKKALSESLGTADRELGTNFGGNVNLIDAFNTFGRNKAANMGLKAIGNRALQRTPAELLGGSLGWKEGGVPGMFAGALGGYALSSPEAIRLMLQGGQSLRPLMPGVWNMIQSNQEQK